MRITLIILLTFFSLNLFAQKDCNHYSEKYIPVDLSDALLYLDCLWSNFDKDSFKNKNEKEAVLELHFGTGMGIRNSWGLWKGKSGIAKYFKDIGIYHPDDMSGIILTSFHRYLNKSELKLNEQVSYYQAYWEKSKKDEIERKKSELMEFSIKDTVEFMYNHGFISKEQEYKYMNDICFAKAILLAKDTIDFKLKINLIESCDESGIIINRGDLYIQDGSEWILKEKDNLEILQVGEIKWTSYEIWETIE